MYLRRSTQDKRCRRFVGGIGQLGGREPVVACADKPIVERLSPIAGFAWREPRHHIEEEAGENDKRREATQAG